jgi:hypothetical protein
LKSAGGFVVATEPFGTKLCPDTLYAVPAFGTRGRLEPVRVRRAVAGDAGDIAAGGVGYRVQLASTEIALTGRTTGSAWR